MSVIMPVFNSEAHLDKSIKSVLAQTYPELELICIDDGSFDATHCKLRAWERLDSRIRVIRHPSNLGVVAALNTGLDAAHGSIVARQDADDSSIPHRLAKQVRWILEDDYDFVCCRARIPDEGGSIPSTAGYLLRHFTFPYWNSYVHGTFMLKRRILVELGGYKETFRHAEDYFLLHLLSMGGYRMKYLYERLYEYTPHGNSVSRIYSEAAQSSLDRLLPLIRSTRSGGSLSISRILWSFRQASRRLRSASGGWL